MKEKFGVSLLIFTFVMFIFVSLFRGSYAADIEEDMIKIDLYNNINKDILSNDIKNFIDLVDNDIIINSSYNMSNTLNQNYDFLTRFVSSFVLNNSEYFNIKTGDNYKYIDDYGREYTTDKYIDIDLFYDITKRIFGVEYFYILDDGLVIEDKVLLVDMEEDNFNMEIDTINKIDSYNNYYLVYVRYSDMDIDYIYRFDILSDNRLVINNLSIGD